LQGVENQMGDAAVQSKNLTTNYRSAKKVIEFNNNLYELAPAEILQHLVTSIEQELPSDLQESIYEKFAMVNLAYKDASQQSPGDRADDAGFISIKFEAKGKDQDSFKETGLPYAISCAEQLQAKGYPLSDIAFLVRTNEEAKLLVQGFLQKSNAGESEYRYDVISADAMYLKNSPVVNFILAVFKFMNDEKDAISLTQVVHDYQTYIKKSTDQNPHSLLGSSDKAINLPEAFTKHILILKRLPLYELVESLIRIFDLTNDHSEWIFVQAFQDAVLDFTKNDSGDLISFMAWWEIKGVKRTVQLNASGNAMSIITIHKAKGLEFPAVVMPFCNWAFDNTGGHDTILWVEGADASMSHTPRLMPLQYKKELSETAYARQYFEEKSKAFIENLNLLYVATTRAENALMIRCEQPAKDGKTLNAGVLIHSFLANSQLTWHKSDDGLHYKLGELDPLVAEEKTKSEYELSNYPSTQWRSKIAIKKSGKQYFDEVRTQSVNIGIIVHDLIAQLQDYTQIDSVLNKAYDQMALNSDDFDAIKKLIHQVMENEEIKKWFTKGLSVKTEPTVLLPTGKQLRMDRVIFEGKKATVIDFKTGLPKDADRKQVREYVSVLADLGYATCEGYLVYLADNNIEKIA
jgi:ATP-dependent helicase/nuclease subunit A